MHWFCSIKLFLKLPFSKKKVIQLSKNHLNYRCFFSDTNLARGFFVECFGILNTFEDEISYFSSQSQTETISDFVLGVSFGGKFVTKSNFTAEVFFVLEEIYSTIIKIIIIITALSQEEGFL